MRRKRQGTNEKPLKKKSKTKQDELRHEYDASIIRQGVRGKHYESYRRGTNLVLLSPDVASLFRPMLGGTATAVRNEIQW